jgi:hypothetical protein
MRRVDITGQRFGRLIALEYSHTDNGKKAVWLCKCNCGNICSVRAKDLRSGNTKSCGCYAVDVAKEVNTKHGASKTRLYNIHSMMKNRCSNPRDSHWEWYGAKGVTVCKEWQRFEPFRDWALANGYAENLVIDRKDSSKGYSPDNCQWITQSENATKANNLRWHSNSKIT